VHHQPVACQVFSEATPAVNESESEAQLLKTIRLHQPMKNIKKIVSLLPHS